MKHVVVNTVEEAERLVTEFEIQSVTKFTIFRRNKGFSSGHGGKYTECQKCHMLSFSCIYTNDLLRCLMATIKNNFEMLSRLISQLLLLSLPGRHYKSQSALG